MRTCRLRWIFAIALLASCTPAQELPTPAPSAAAVSPSATEVARPSAAATPATAAPTRRLLFTPTPLPTTRLLSGLITHENVLLGYRITLPEARRRSASFVTTDNGVLGSDVYTARTEDADREACLKDGGGRPGPDGDPDLIVGASRNTAGESAEAFVTTPRVPGGQPMSTAMLVERATVDGREAVRLVRDQLQNHETTGYVIRADDRIYTLGFGSDSIPSRAPGFLDAVAATFHVIQPLPVPTAIPTPSPKDAARDASQRLARAFAARDADAVAAVITPSCWIGTIPAVAPGVGVDGSSRAVVPLLVALRDAFDRDGLVVLVAPDISLDATGTSAVVRSDWTAAGATVRIDLELRPVDGTFYWTGARHYDLASASCPIVRVIAGSSPGRC